MARYPEQEALVKLNDLSADTRFVQLGYLVLGTEITGSLEASGFADGQEIEFEVDHTLEGTFLDNPMPSFEDLAGFVITPVLSGTNGSKFRVMLKYVAAEYVYYHGTESGAGGAATIAWTRRGVLLRDP